MKGYFAPNKRTINKLKLSSRTVRLVHREAEVLLLALQILLAHADLTLRSEKAIKGEPAISPRKVLLAIRRELKGSEKRRVPSYTKSGKFAALLFHGLCRLGKIDWASESHQELDRCLSKTITASKNFND